MFSESEIRFASVKKPSSLAKSDQQQSDDALDVDHVYLQKFNLQSSIKKTFREQLNSYLDEMLNKLGIIFFKAQIYYGEDIKGQDVCIIEFHLFALKCLTDEVEDKISAHVKELLNRFDGAAKLDTTEMLTRGKTSLRKPVYKPAKPRYV